MADMAEQAAPAIFWFWDYFLMPRPTGKKAANLREMLQYLREMSEAALNYHFWQSRLAIRQPTIEYPHDFALWAADALHDNNLAEKLSSIDPFDYQNLLQAREAMVELLEEYLWDFPQNTQVLPGYEFYFCEASAVIMRSGIKARSLQEFCLGLRTAGLDAVYFHFVEARRRLGDRKVDDFSHWIGANFALPELVSAIRNIDISFYTLAEIRDTVLALIEKHAGQICEQPEGL